MERGGKRSATLLWIHSALNSFDMKGNTPIPELAHGEDVWLMVVVTSVRERRTQQGKVVCEPQARISPGTHTLKIWREALETWKEMKPGLWGVTGKLETFQDRSQFVL